MLTLAFNIQTVKASGNFYAMPNEYHISGVPFVKQEPMWCGPASLTMVLNYWGDPVSQNEVGSAVDPEHDGTKPWHMIPFLESRGYVVYEFDRYSLEYRVSVMDELRIWVCHDYPIVVRQWTDLSKQSGHYRVVVGYDAEKIYVIDPNFGSTTFSVEYFMQLWERNNEYGLVVIGDTARDSDGDQQTDSNEVMQNTDPFDIRPRVSACDQMGNDKNMFCPAEDVYAKGSKYPASTEVAIYIIPDGYDLTPGNAKTVTFETTETDGTLVATLVWNPPLDLGEYDIWVDVNQNSVFDHWDVCNDQTITVLLDTDGDETPDITDPDDDNDGTNDDEDAFPLDPTETVDTDGDGIGNNADADDDNDGVQDVDDAFPLNASESLDTDSDGVGNNADPDDDNDDINDDEDAFPLDPTESVDTDEDGVGDNSDTDDDNDGMPDTWETENGLNPLDPADASLDPDGDDLTNLQEYQEDTDPNVSDAEAAPLWILGAIAAVVIGIAAATAAFLLRRRK